MFPMLRKYEELNSKNRMDKWIQYLEDRSSHLDYRHDGKYEVSTMINNNTELHLTKLDLENQSVIALDINRCRNSIQNCKNVAEKMITLFCKSHKIKYKQGMNELISLFLSQPAEEIEHYHIYNCFTRFMHLFMPTFYNDTEFLSLQ